MEITLIILTSTLMGALFVGFFMLGYLVKGKQSNNEGVTITEQNRQYIEEMMRWKNYGGK